MYQSTWRVRTEVYDTDANWYRLACIFKLLFFFLCLRFSTLLLRFHDKANGPIYWILLHQNMYWAFYTLQKIAGSSFQHFTRSGMMDSPRGDYLMFWAYARARFICGLAGSSPQRQYSFRRQIISAYYKEFSYVSQNLSEDTQESCITWASFIWTRCKCKFP